MSQVLFELHYKDHEENDKTLNLYAKDVTDFTYNGQPFTTSLLAPNFASSVSGYGWNPIEESNYWYRSTWFPDNTSYIPIANYSRRNSDISELTALRAKMNDLMDSMVANPDENNILTLSSSESEQFYGIGAKDEGLTDDQRIVNGQVFYFGEGATSESGPSSLTISLFTYDGVVEGQPVTKTYVGGLQYIKPYQDNSATFLIGKHACGVYSTEDPPMIGLFRVPILCNSENDPAEYAGKTINAILILLRIPGSISGQDYQKVATFVSENALGGVNVPDDTTHSDPGTNVTPNGWTGNWNFSSADDVNRAPTAYTFTNKWAHGIRTYKINDAIGEALMASLWHKTLYQTIEQKIGESLFGKNYDWIKGIVALHKLPVIIPTNGTNVLTVFGSPIAGATTTTLAVPVVSGDVVTVESNPLYVDESLGEQVFLDYSHAQAYINLPFVGKIPMDIRKCRGGYLEVVYYIQMLTGNCVAKVYATSKKLPMKEEGNQGGHRILMYQGSGNCAVSIPFSGNSEGAFKQLGALAGLAGGAVASVATGNPLPLAGAMTSQLSGGHSNTAEYNYMASESAALFDPQVSLVIEGVFPVVAPNQQEVIGFSACCTGQVKNFAKYPGKENPELLQGTLESYISGATGAENDEIRSLFERGVIV